MLKKSCVDKNKKVHSGYYADVYHATIFPNEICENGIKPSSEFDKGVLGSANKKTDKTISFTIDPQIAINIAKDFEMAIKIMNKNVNWDNIKEELDKHDNNIEPLILVKPKPDAIFCGYTENSPLRCDTKYARKMKVKPSEIIDDLRNLSQNEFKTKYNRNKPYKAEYCESEWSNVNHFKDATQYEKDRATKNLALCWAGAYIPIRYAMGGRHDPYFASTTIWENFTDKDINDVIVLKYKGYLPQKEIKIGHHDNKLHEIHRFGKLIKKDYEFENYDPYNDDQYDEMKNHFKSGEITNKEIKISRKYLLYDKKIPLKTNLDNYVVLKKWNHNELKDYII